MSQKDFISGSILEFKVPGDFGYAYCKILDFRSIRLFDGVICKVYDHIVKEPIKDVNILRDKQWLFGARRMPWLPGTRGRGAWKMKGVIISSEDNNIPDFKYCFKSHPLIENKMEFETWDAVKNINQYVPCGYEGVKHLEDTIVSPRLGIAIRTGMEICRRDNIDLPKYFPLDNEANKLIYRQMNQVPIYKTIPVEKRGKAIC